MKGQKTFIFIAEVPLILSKDNANRVQYKMKGQETFIFIAEVPLLLSKDNANRVQYKMKSNRLSFLLPRCRLSYLNIMQKSD